MHVAREVEEIIEQWMLTIVRDGGGRRFDDLHIDRIDPKWSAKSQWIKGGLEAFRIAVEIRNRNHLPYAVGLGFSLSSGDELRGLDFRTEEEFSGRLDSSPPSLYLFQRGEEPRSQAVAQDIGPVILSAPSGTRCYHIEFKQEGFDEHCRSVFVEG